ncbi:MAG: TrmB family transcriptional regulator [Candidatus Micrarchaeales archaeon]
MQLEEVLKKIGFNEYKIKTYKALFSLGTASPSSISKEAKIPLPRVYGILQELLKEGFALMIPGRPTKFKPIPPSSAIIPLIDKRIQEEISLKEEIKKVEEEFISKELPKKEILVFQGWEIIKGIMKRDILSSKKEILAFIRFGKTSPELMEAMEKVIKKGVKIKVLGPYAKEREHIMLQHKLIGCEVKTIDWVVFPLIRFSVFDGAFLFFHFYSPPQKEDAFYVRIEDEESAKLFRKIFMALWEKGKPL